MFSKDMIRMLVANENMDPYAFIITESLLPDDEAAVGQRGPADGRFGYVATDADFAEVARIGRDFQLLDDDGEIYYRGKIWTKDEPGSEADFRPLDDFGEPYGGCTEIQYKNSESGEWETL